MIQVDNFLTEFFVGDNYKEKNAFEGSQVDNASGCPTSFSMS